MTDEDDEVGRAVTAQLFGTRELPSEGANPDDSDTDLPDTPEAALRRLTRSLFGNR